MILKISRNGRITIPKKIRATLNICSGDKIIFKIDPENNLQLIPIKSSIKELKGFLPKPEK